MYSISLRIHLHNIYSCNDSTWTEINLDEIEIEEMIGGGGFALVYRAVYNGNLVAMKALVI